MAQARDEVKSTEDRLVDAAISLFSQKWYGTVSVAEICRSAGLSNGVFYRYYASKEALFRRILEKTTDMIRSALAAVEGATPRDRLRSFVEILVRFSEEHKDIVSVFREGQYRFFEYERRLVELYEEALGAAIGATLGPGGQTPSPAAQASRRAGLPEYLFVLGGVRFCAIRRALHGLPIPLEAIHAVIEGGAFPGERYNPDKVFGGSVLPLPIDLEEGARERLLKAGKRLFGENGYFETNIHEITDAAGLSVGAFYTYFESKESFYEELIHMVGHEVRSFISRNLGSPGTRLERELRGIWLFLVHLSIDKYCYNIVREAEFVLPDAVREYYRAFTDGYRKSPGGNGPVAARGPAEEEAVIEYLLGISHYFGIEVAFDESPANARAVVETIGRYLSRGFSEYLS